MKNKKIKNLIVSSALALLLSQPGFVSFAAPTNLGVEDEKNYKFFVRPISISDFDYSSDFSYRMNPNHMSFEETDEHELIDENIKDLVHEESSNNREKNFGLWKNGSIINRKSVYEYSLYKRDFNYELKIGDIVTVNGSGRADSYGSTYLGNEWNNQTMVITDIKEDRVYPYLGSIISKSADYNSNMAWFNEDMVSLIVKPGEEFVIPADVKYSLPTPYILKYDEKLGYVGIKQEAKPCDYEYLGEKATLKFTTDTDKMIIANCFHPGADKENLYHKAEVVTTYIEPTIMYQVPDNFLNGEYDYKLLGNKVMVAEHDKVMVHNLTEEEIQVLYGLKEPYDYEITNENMRLIRQLNRPGHSPSWK